MAGPLRSSEWTGADGPRPLLLLHSLFVRVRLCLWVEHISTESHIPFFPEIVTSNRIPVRSEALLRACVCVCTVVLRSPACVSLANWGFVGILVGGQCACSVTMWPTVCAHAVFLDLGLHF